jgi:hypothetical protein
MKILLAHNYYRQPGGEDEVFASETRLLRDRGHEVVQFSLCRWLLERSGTARPISSFAT